MYTFMYVRTYLHKYALHREDDCNQETYNNKSNISLDDVIYGHNNIIYEDVMNYQTGVHLLTTIPALQSNRAVIT